MGHFIPYGHQWIDDQDVDAVVKVLRSDFLTQGPAVESFEKALRDSCGAQHCVAVANGTAALHLAVAALQLERGSEGITSPITFAASANCMVYNGLRPTFADIDERTYNIDPEEIRSRVTSRTRLLLPVDFAGQPADMQTISEVARDIDASVIEDAAHAIGSCYPDGATVGSCEYSDMTIFSFHPVKTITTGEGGAIATNSDELYERLLLLRSHGITRDQNRLSSHPGPWYYEMQALGFNYRLTDLQAALGVSQLSRLAQFKARRRQIVARYNAAFEAADFLTVPFESPKLDSAVHLYVLGVDFMMLGMSRAEAMEQLREQGIGSQVHYIPLHLQPFYRENFGFKEGDFPKAERYYERELSIPLYPHMSDSDVDRVIDAVLDLENDRPQR